MFPVIAYLKLVAEVQMCHVSDVLYRNVSIDYGN